MGEDPPRKFALKESYVVMRGVLPEIGVSAEESAVRSCVAKVIRHSEKTLADLAPTDFEFLEACGKCLCVPAYSPDFMWTGRAVKELAGTGAIYVRLTVEREDDDSASSNGGSASESPEPEVKFVKIETPGKCCLRGKLMH